jgi:hypothetical protein
MDEYSSNSYQNEQKNVNEADPISISSQSNILDQTPNSASTLSKSSLEKCQDISIELNNLEKEILKFEGKKNDKLFLKLEELVTRCLLKLDEIERGDEQLNQLRKSLINFSHQLSDKLEVKANANQTTNNIKINEENTQMSNNTMENLPVSEITEN